jgi:hypothetical protein
MAQVVATKAKTVVEINFESEVSNQVADFQFLYKGDSTHKQEFLDAVTSVPVFLGKCYLDEQAIQKPLVSLTYNELKIALDALPEGWEVKSSNLPKIAPQIDEKMAKMLEESAKMGIAVY